MGRPLPQDRWTEADALLLQASSQADTLCSKVCKREAHAVSCMETGDWEVHNDKRNSPFPTTNPLPAQPYTTPHWLVPGWGLPEFYIRSREAFTVFRSRSAGSKEISAASTLRNSQKLKSNWRFNKK